jgi:LacI family transcriptional regulator, repressor for deo operon, udp, cdd, tsx, nupC, and nupG
VSIAQVSERAGVPVDVVARALCGGDVPPQASEAVLSAARHVGFLDWAAPGRGAAARPVTVAVLVPFLDRWFFTEVLSSVSSVLERARARVVVYHIPNANRRTMFFDHLPLRHDIDAVLVVSLVLTDSEINALTRRGRPLGVLGAAVPGMLSTRIDDVAGARTAVEHLIQAGHERIALIGDNQNAPMRYVPPRDRRVGYQQALAAAGLVVDPRLDVDGGFTAPGGARAAHILLDAPHPPSAIFCGSDEMAWGAVTTLVKRGLRVLHDIAVMGYDDHPMAALMDLSTVRQPVAAQAVDLAARLLARIAAREPREDEYDVVLPTELVIRASTDPARATPEPSPSPAALG